MSWKLTNKLKERHLGPLSSFPISASNPSSMDKGNDGKALPAGADNPALPNSSEIADIEPLHRNHAVKTPWPGILAVTLHEAQGLSLPHQHRHAFASTCSTDSSSMEDAASVTSLAQPHDSSRPSNALSVPTVHGRVPGKYRPYALVDFDKMQVLIESVDGNPENLVWAGPSTQHKFDVSRAAELKVHLYLRNPIATPGSERTQDICLGVARLNPQFGPLEGIAPVTGEQDQPLGFRGVGWVDVRHGTGRLQVGVDYIETARPGNLSIDNFELLRVVGKGSFGRVLQGRKKDTSRIFALRIVRKAKLIIPPSEDAHTFAERSVLAQINNPFIAPLMFTFQSPSKLYLVLPFVQGGELFGDHLSKEGRFDVDRCRFYAAELLCALECLHGLDMIYRDLKPDNILLDYQGHIALCDFGLCGLEMKDESRIDTPCGAPELLLGQEYNETVDWWTLGALLHEMLTGRPPFNDEAHESLHFPEDDADAVPPAAKDILTKLLNKKPSERLGANGATEIKSHPFFHDIDWRKLLQREYEPAFKPSEPRAPDMETCQLGCAPGSLEDSYVDGPVLSQAMRDQFAGFTYNRPIFKDPSFLDGSDRS